MSDPRIEEIRCRLGTGWSTDELLLIMWGELGRLRAEVERLRAALSFYGDHLSYGKGRYVIEGTVPEVVEDGGKLARRALTNEQLAPAPTEDGDFEPHNFMRRK